MKQRLLHALLISVLVTLAIVPVASAQDDQQVLLYGGNQDIENIDPAVGENYSINAALRSLYDALFIYRGNDIESHLVESWEVNADATVWTFKLREDVSFHDGSPLNAEAVVYSFNRILEINGPPNYRWSTIADENTVKALDEYTVEFTLTQPFAPFIGTLPQLFVINPTVCEANLGDDFCQTYLREHEAGSGPFTQGRWEIGNLYEFIAVDDYWGWKNATHLDSFIWIIQRDSATMLNSLLAGETHIADSFDANNKDQVDEAEGYTTYLNPGYFTDTLKMNNQGEYTSDINLRKAIAYAMNYDALPEVQDVPVQVLQGPMPLNFIGAVEGLEVPTYDLDKAREYLAQTPWPDGGIELDYVYVTEFPREEVPGLLMLEGLAEIGITLNMVPMLWPDMVASCADPSTGPDLINIYTLPAYLDPDAFLYNQYHSEQWGSFNSCSFYKNERVDELLDEARILGDMEERLPLYAEAQALIAADQPSVWMYTEDQLIAMNECVQGYVYSPMYPVTVLFQDLWLEGCN